jgi:hypothetical protein
MEPFPVEQSNIKYIFARTEYIYSNPCQHMGHVSNFLSCLSRM